MRVRGQDILSDKEKMELHIYIRHPQGHAFSLSDKLVQYTKYGFKIIVHLPDRVQIVDMNTPHFHVETVKSKFPNAKSWYRLWFKMESVEKQMTFV